MDVLHSIANIAKSDMKKILFTILCLSIFSCSTKLNQSKINPAEIEIIKASQEFVQGSEDIPLPEGMEKVFDDGLGFDSENGSLMSSSYKTKNNPKTIKEFYFKTLPQMGWNLSKSKNPKNSADQKIKFIRDNERLEIEFVKEKEENLVKFFLSSAL